MGFAEYVEGEIIRHNKLSPSRRVRRPEIKEALQAAREWLVAQGLEITPLEEDEEE